MYKKAVILLTFLAYSLTLVHSLVPHHHHQQAKAHYHHHENGHDHHHDDDRDKSLSHAFADAIHNPASEAFTHPSPPQQSVKKKVTAPAFPLVIFNDLIHDLSKPPDADAPPYQEKHYGSQPHSFSLLRAPPAS